MVIQAVRKNGFFVWGLGLGLGTVTFCGRPQKVTVPILRVPAKKGQSNSNKFNHIAKSHLIKLTVNSKQLH